MFPETLDISFYRNRYPDLRNLSDAELVTHYERFGKPEGRAANALLSRTDFIALIPNQSPVLEIGPFFRPVAQGAHVRYFDILSHNELVQRATSLRQPTDAIPDTIHYVNAEGDLSVVDASFRSIVGRHILEHQPDLIAHFQHIERILETAGHYFLLIPDKRYCFDHFLPESTIADVIAAHEEKRKAPAVKSIIEHRALTTHNDTKRHWNEDHGNPYDGMSIRITNALREYRAAQGAYIDVHCWYFTPERFSQVFSVLNEMGLVSLRLHRLYPTRRDSNEFWVILEKSSSG